MTVGVRVVLPSPASWLSSLPVWWLWTAASGVSLALGWVLAPETLLRGVAGLVGLVAVPAVVTPAVRLPALGVAALLVAAVLMPLDISRGGTPMDVTVLIALGVCATALLRRWLSTRSAAPLTRVERAVAAFLAVSALAFVVGQYPWFPVPAAPMSAQVGGLALFLLSGGIFLAVGREMQSLRELEHLTWLFLSAGTLALVLIVVQPFTSGGLLFDVVDATTVGSMFWTWLVAMAASQALCNRALALHWRWALAGVALLALARGLLMAFSWVSGWLPPVVALGAVVALRFPRLALGAGVMAATPALLVTGDALAPVAAGESYSLMTRLEAIQVLWQVVERNPWLGLGPANYHYYTLQFPILGWYVRFNSHNQYLDLVAQVGAVGLVAFLWFVAEAARLAWRLKSEPRSWFARAYAVGVLGGIAGSLVAAALADWIVPFVYNIGIQGFRSSLLFWFFLGGALALRRLALAGVEPALTPRVLRHG